MSRTIFIYGHIWAPNCLFVVMPGLVPPLSGSAFGGLCAGRRGQGGAVRAFTDTWPHPVMPGLVPGIHVLRHRAVSGDKRAGRPTWMPGTSPGMTAGDGGGGGGGAAKVVSPVARYVGNPPLRGPFARN